ncbi:MAG: phosphatase PAP2 family protein [Candidatus Izemoplasmatales bacterium]|nr:phosphatase PAP2 family protein [Candidatus Izemoplasmatales bacterium]
MSFELELIHWLQSFRNGFWDAFFQLWTMFGEELVIIGVLGYLYWAYNKKVGEQVGVTVFLSLVMNSIIKVIVARPRPFVVDDTITNVRPSTSGGYAFPSGHTQGASTLFGSIAVWMKKRWITIVATIIIVMVAVSRMYLGVHYFSDVVVGGLLGIGMAFLMNRFFQKSKHIDRFYQWLLVGSAGAFLAALIVYSILYRNETYPGTEIYAHLEDVSKMLGSMVGFVVGVRFEQSKVKFSQHQVLWKNAIRFVGGVAVVMAVRLLLKAVFGLIVNPEELVDLNMFQSYLASLFDFLRYVAMVFIGIGVYPMLFQKVRI